MPEITDGKSRVIGKIGEWVFVEIKYTRENGDKVRRWSAVFMRPEKMIKKTSKNRKKKIPLLMRRTEIVVDANEESFVAYSHILSSKKKGGETMFEPDPIPLLIIHKLIELREENKSPIILPKGNIDIPKLIK